MATRKPLFSNSDGFGEEMATTDDIVVGGISSSGDIGLTGGSEVTGLPATPGGATAAASKAYVDSVAAGLDPKESVRASSHGLGNVVLATDAEDGDVIDGVTLGTGDRILLAEQTTSTEDGIYIVAASGAPARSADAQTGATFAGVFLFVEEGTANADKGLVCTNDQGSDVVGTDNLAFVLFSSAGAVTGGNGIDVSSGVISVDLDTDAGLEFDSALLQVKLNGTTLDRAAAGMSVLGLPALFTIATVAVGSDVTAANLDTLTDASNADALHVHAAASATDAPLVKEDLAVVEAVAIGDAVEWSATNDRIQVCDAAVGAKIDVFGIAITAQAVVGNDATIVRRGIAVGAIAAATAGARYWLANGGGITATKPAASGDYLVIVGTATNATDLEVVPQFLGRLA